MDAFYLSNGTQTVLEKDKKLLLEAYGALTKKYKKTTHYKFMRRGMHLGNEIITQPGDGLYWNTHHQILMGVPVNPDTCICKLKALTSHPKPKTRMLREGLKNTVGLVGRAFALILITFLNILAATGLLLWSLVRFPFKLLYKRFILQDTRRAAPLITPIPEVPPPLRAPEYESGGQDEVFTTRQRLREVECTFIKTPEATLSRAARHP